MFLLSLSELYTIFIDSFWALYLRIKEKTCLKADSPFPLRSFILGPTSRPAFKGCGQQDKSKEKWCCPVNHMTSICASPHSYKVKLLIDIYQHDLFDLFPITLCYVLRRSCELTSTVFQVFFAPGRKASFLSILQRYCMFASPFRVLRLCQLWSGEIRE